MSAFNLRRRQIDIDKPIPIIYDEIPDLEMESCHTRGTVEVNVSNMPVEEEQEKHLREILGNARNGTVEAIPTPTISILPEYGQEQDPFPLKTPVHYIRYSDIEQNTSHIEYDMDDEDELFLASLKSNKGIELSELDFEYLIDFLEKEENLYPHLKCNLDGALAEVRPNLRHVLPDVFHYWKQRVEKEGRPLLRRFLNHALERDPFAAFVVKTPTIQASQNQKKRVLEDERAIARLHHVKQQFQQVLLILKLVRQREELKMKRVRLLQHILELLVQAKSGQKSLAPGATQIASLYPEYGRQNAAAAAGGMNYNRNNMSLPGQISSIHLNGANRNASNAAASNLSGFPNEIPTQSPRTPKLTISRKKSTTTFPNTSSTSQTTNPSGPSSAGTDASTSVSEQADVTPKLNQSSEFYMADPNNLLRSYPYYAGNKKSKNAKNSASNKAKNPQINSITGYGILPVQSLFASTQTSPFFDPITQQRYDSYQIFDDDKLALEEFEMECDEEEDPLSQIIIQSSNELFPTVHNTCKINQDGLQIYDPHPSSSVAAWGFDSTSSSYDPTDTLLLWKKDDVDYLRHAAREAMDSRNDLTNLTTDLETKPVVAANSNPTYTPQSVDPILLSNPQKGFHIFTPRFSMQSNNRAELGPRRFQATSTITKTSVNGLSFNSWASLSDIPRRLQDTCIHSQTKRPSSNADLNSFSPPTKKIKIANTNGSADLHSIDQLSSELPPSIYYFREHSSFGTVDIERTDCPPFRGRQRLARGGRIVWDRLPIASSPLDSPSHLKKSNYSKIPLSISQPEDTSNHLDSASRVDLAQESNGLNELEDCAAADSTSSTTPGDGNCADPISGDTTTTTNGGHSSEESSDSIGNQSPFPIDSLSFGDKHISTSSNTIHQMDVESV